MAVSNLTPKTGKPAPRIVFNLAGVDLVVEDPREADLHCLGEQLISVVQMAVDVETLGDDHHFSTGECSTLYELLRVARDAYEAARTLRLGGCVD